MDASNSEKRKQEKEKEPFISFIKKSSFYQQGKKKEFAKELEDRMIKDGKKGKNMAIQSPHKGREKQNPDFIADLNDAFEHFVNMENLIGVEKIRNTLENSKQQQANNSARRFTSKISPITINHLNSKKGTPKAINLKA